MRHLKYVLIIVVLLCFITQKGHAQLSGHLNNNVTMISRFYDDDSFSKKPISKSRERGLEAKGDETINWFKTFYVRSGHILAIDDFRMTTHNLKDIKNIKEKNQQRNYLKREEKFMDSVQKIIGKVTPSDTVILAVDKSLSKADTGNFQYKVSRDGQPYANWKEMDFSEKNRLSGSYYTLVAAPLVGHKYTVDIKRHSGKAFGQVVFYNDYREPDILGVFFAEQKEQLYKMPHYKISDSFNARTLPHIQWEKYQNRGGYDTMGFGSTVIHNFMRKNGVNFDGKKYQDSIRKDPFIVPAELDIPSTHNNVLFLLDPVPDSIGYKYYLVADEHDLDTNIKWTQNPDGSNIIELKGIRPGSYKLYIKYTHINSQSRVYYITIRPQWYQSAWFSFLKGFLLGLSLVLVPFFIYRYMRRQKRKQKELRHKMTALQLQSYRAQLNPHFIFNALSSIQSLVNTDDKERANEYLTDFSLLLRMTLDQQKSEFWTLQDEADLLRKYVRLEQLRFCFAFDISIDNSIATNDIAFPSMLLQPVVENAIKHGISGYHDPGRLSIKMQAKGNDLVITVTDNGKGFDVHAIKEGSHGLNLTKERIASLNEQDKVQRITLDIKSSAQGTEATFYLYHYLHA